MNNKKPKRAQEVYGLDIELLEGLGLGDIVDGLADSPPKKTSEEDHSSSKKSGTLTYEQMCQKYSNKESDEPKVTNRLRGICREYKND